MHPSSSRSSDTAICDEPAVAGFSRLMAGSFLHWTGNTLTDEADIPTALYHAPFGLVAHGTEPDPVFCYANLTAQKLWAMNWADFTSMPSRLCAEAVAVPERERVLQQAAKLGFVDDYEGIRISSEKKRFRIHGTVLWNVVDEHGTLLGQAAAIRNWEWL